MASRFRSAVKRATFDFFPAFIQALTLADARTRNKNSQTIKKLTFQRFFLPFSIPTSANPAQTLPILLPPEIERPLIRSSHPASHLRSCARACACSSNGKGGTRAFLCSIVPGPDQGSSEMSVSRSSSTWVHFGSFTRHRAHPVNISLLIKVLICLIAASFRFPRYAYFCVV